jgi:hypothetical protein
MNKLIYLIAGLIIGLILPFLVDYALFNKLQPCKTVSTNPTVQICE